MTTNRLVMLGLGVACIVVLALGWFLGVKPQLDTASASDASTAEVQSENLTHQTDLANLKKQFGDLASLQAKLAVLKKSLPSSIDAPGLIGSINATAQLVGVSVSTVSIGDPAIYSPGAAVGATPTAPATGGTATVPPSATPAPAASSAPVTSGSGGSVAVNPADSALVSTGNFITVPINISITASFSQMLNFITAVQSSTRLFLVTQASFAGGAGTITGLIYVLVDPATAGGATTGSGATPTPTPSISATQTPTPTPTPSGSLTPTPTATTKP